MAIKIDSAVYLNEQGKRDYSEDYIFPSPDTAAVNQRLFMVCDGVGGSARGDLAAQIACTTFPAKIEELSSCIDEKSDIISAQKDLLLGALIATEKHLDCEVAKNPMLSGMATTMTYLHFLKRSAVIAWIGDSRVYHFSKNGDIKYVTEDHSLVAELIKKNQITKEEALQHPRRNVILRAISGSDQPAKIDFHIIQSETIEAGDYFLLCTDGILEGVSEANFQNWIKMEKKPEQMKIEIAERCQQFSRDNYSMYLIRIDNQPTLDDASDYKRLATKKEGILPHQIDKGINEIILSTEIKKSRTFITLLFFIFIILIIAYYSRLKS